MSDGAVGCPGQCGEAVGYWTDELLVPSFESLGEPAGVTIRYLVLVRNDRQITVHKCKIPAEAGEQEMRRDG